MDIENKLNTYKNCRAELAQIKANEKEVRSTMKELETEFIKHLNEIGQKTLDFAGGSISLEIAKINFKDESKKQPKQKKEKSFIESNTIPKTEYKTIIDIENELKKKKKKPVRKE
jgi:hypothetical protein